MVNQAIVTVAPAIVRRAGVKNRLHVFAFYSSAAITVANNLREWIIPFYCKVVDVIAYTDTAPSGASADIIDITRNGTTIYTTAGNRPTLAPSTTGIWSRYLPDAINGVGANSFVPGDILSLDCKQVGSGGGSARLKVFIIVECR